ncbi:MAG TPA: CocE/NonD family hydrolase [Mycobacteriales bacterium]|nr:CocE/NonD family hydrolase [Mycobacteriales bacterium]
MRTRTVLATVALATAGLAAPASQAASAPYRTVSALVGVLDGPHGAHHATLDTTLYLPTSATPEHPAAAVLIAPSFALTKTAPEVTQTADYLARHGFVVLAYTAQGFGASSGCIQLDSAGYDGLDASQLITRVLAPRRDIRHDARGPVVGMLGGAYGGAAALLAAELDHRIRAVVASRVWNSLQFSLVPNNWLPAGAPPAGAPPGADLQRTSQGVFKAGWASLYYAVGNAQPATGSGGCLAEKAATADAAGASCPGFTDQVCTAYDSVAATGNLTSAQRALLAGSSPATFLDRLDAATLLVQGERDTLFTVNETVATYDALRHRHVPVEMIWSSGGHGGYASAPGEGDVYDGATHDLARSYLPQRMLAWFDRWLDAAPVSTGPGFSYFEDWAAHHGSGPDSDAYGTAAAYPAQRPFRMLLSAGNLLVPDGFAIAGGSSSFLRPDGGRPAAYSAAAACSWPDAATPRCPESLPDALPAAEVSGEYAAWTSAPLCAPATVVGLPRLHIHLSHLSTADLVFFAKLYDIAPDGTATLIGRLSSPARIPSAALAHGVDIALQGIAHRFAAGHAIRLVLDSTDLAYGAAGVAGQLDQIVASFGAGNGSYGGTPSGQLTSESATPDSSALFLPVSNPQALSPLACGG